MSAKAVPPDSLAAPPSAADIRRPVVTAPSEAEETREAYFAILSKLVTKLETAEKPLKEILQEMMAEAMTEVLQMIQA